MPESTLVRPAPARRPVGPAPAAQPRDTGDGLLWSSSALARWAGAVAVAGLVLVGSWFAIAGKGDWNDQRPYMSFSIALVVVVSFLSLSMLLTGRRAIGLRRIELLGDLPVQQPAQTDTAPAAPAGRPTSEVLVAGEQLVRYHRADCPLTVGRDYQASDRTSHVAAGRLPCGVCLP